MRVSLVIAAHNEGEKLWKTIESCAQASGKLHYEVVVSDDASTDGSVDEAVKRFPRARVVRGEDRQGASPAKASGAASARGETLVFLDGHCKPEPGAIERLVSSVELLSGRAIITPRIAALCPRLRRSTSALTLPECCWSRIRGLRFAQTRAGGSTSVGAADIG